MYEVMGGGGGVNEGTRMGEEDEELDSMKKRIENYEWTWDENQINNKECALLKLEMWWKKDSSSYIDFKKHSVVSSWKFGNG